IALALPEVEEGTSWGASAFKLRGKMIACQPTNKAAESDSLVVMLDFAKRDELLAAEPDVYYLKEHYVGYPCLLVRLKKIHHDGLRDLIGMARKYVDAKSKRRRRPGAIKRRSAVGAIAIMVCGLALPANGQTEPTAEEIARSVVIGQAYPSGNVYVAGFIDTEPRSWPRRIAGVPLNAGRAQRITADFFRIVAQDSEEHYWFPQREADTFEDDVFATIDRAAIEDRNLARYRAPAPFDKAIGFFGWGERLELIDVRHAAADQLRPVTAAERKQVAANRSAIPKDFECTTVPRFLDDAKILLTAHVARTKFSIRLSKYSTPGCAGHLADIYVLDVLAPGEEPRRFEFLHYQGVL
ncbi:MAG: MmcQ/YjbR family DNA-binding protein, partial [Vicinamibacterales bacterium]